MLYVQVENLVFDVCDIKLYWSSTQLPNYNKHMWLGACYRVHVVEIT